jgi:TPR repeat protein
LGSIYLWGPDPIGFDYEKAAEWFSKAVSWSDSQLYFGYMHIKGYHFEVNLREALRYFNSADHNGHALAQYGMDLIENIQMMSPTQVTQEYKEFDELVKDAFIYREDVPQPFDEYGYLKGEFIFYYIKIAASNTTTSVNNQNKFA